MRVREARVALGWSIPELAKRSGLSQKTIRRLERGESVYDHTFSRVILAFNESGRLKSAIGQEQVVIDNFEEAKKMKRA
jgi:transcriptional regulator with XRE-family HTH domain